MPTRIGAELAAWLADRPARDRSRAAIAAFAARWAEDTPLPALTRALAALDNPSAEAMAALIAPLLTEAGWIERLVARLIDEVARDRFFEPPLAPVQSDVQAGLVLHACPLATIAIGVGALDRLAAKKRRDGGGTIAFPGYLSLIRVIRSGGPTLSLWDGGWRGDAPLERCRPIGRRRLVDGELLRIDGRTTSFLVEHARADMVLLHATIFAGAAPTSCDYDRETLALANLAAASERASRTEMLTTLLRALDRPDPQAFDAATRSGEGSARWQAMREWLTIDADAATPRLAEMASHDADAELRSLAARTMALVACPA